MAKGDVFKDPNPQLPRGGNLARYMEAAEKAPDAPVRDKKARAAAALATPKPARRAAKKGKRK